MSFFGWGETKSSVGNVQFSVHVTCICGDITYPGGDLSLEFRRAVGSGEISLMSPEENENQRGPGLCPSSLGLVLKLKTA